MSSDNQTDIMPENGNPQEASAPNAPEASPPQAEVHPAVANFRKGFYTDSRYGVLAALGEEPEEYKEVKDGGPIPPPAVAPA